MSGGQLPALTGLRSFAATLVFIRHAYTDLDHSFPGLEMLGNIGYAGVTLFFVLSGFVLAWAGYDGNYRSFYWRRFARVYPLYFVAVLIWFGLAWHFDLFGDFGSKTIAILPSLLLVQSWIPDQSIYFGWGGAVLWSLSCEAFFYLAFPLVYRRMSRRDPSAKLKLTVAVVVPASAIACLASFAGSRYDLAAFVFPGLRIGEFVLGVALGTMAREGVRATRRQRRWLGLFAYTWLVVPLLAGYDHGHRQGLIDTVALPATAIMIFLLGTREADGSRVPVVGARPLTYFGKVSYSFYLIHPVVLTAVIRLGLFETSSSFETIVVFAASFASTLVLASALHHAVERPAQVWLLGLARKPPSDGHGFQPPVSRKPPGADIAATRPREKPSVPSGSSSVGTRGPAVPGPVKPSELPARPRNSDTLSQCLVDQVGDRRPG